MSAAAGPPGQGWHLLSAPVPSAEKILAASDSAADARALPQDEPVGRQADASGDGAASKKSSQSGKPRRRNDGAGNGRVPAQRTASLTALVEGERHKPVRRSQHFVAWRSVAGSSCSVACRADKPLNCT